MNSSQHHSKTEGQGASPRSPNAPAWLPDFLQSLDLSPSASLDQYFQAADQEADSFAPVTRRGWTWIVGLQGLAVVIPLLWVLAGRGLIAPVHAGLVVLACTLAMVAICWWLRWRGTQLKWVRSRLITEIARSRLHSGSLHPEATRLALEGAPQLAAIANALPPTTESEGGLEQRVENYLAQRVNHQIDYYHDKRKEAQKERVVLSRVVTRSLDFALFLAVGGLLIALRGDAANWLVWSGSEYLLAFLGSLLPLVAILAQLRGSYREVDRRVGRYAQQEEFLQQIKQEFLGVTNEDAARSLVATVERSLLSENAEWYYQTENSHHYYRARPLVNSRGEQAKCASNGLKGRVLDCLGASLGFVGKVVFGRLVVVGLSVVFSTALINYRRAPEVTLGEWDGTLLSPVAQKPYAFWQPSERTTENGLMIIVHGLQDAVDLQAGTRAKQGQPVHWMTRMETTLRTQLGERCPDLCLIDWREAARPTKAQGKTVTLGVEHYFDAGFTEFNSNLVMIQNQGEKVGDRVGKKLAEHIRNGQIPRDGKIHLVGHSAGGFVVLRIARQLERAGVAPENLRVTLLDTPLPKAEELKATANYCAVDFYRTSVFTEKFVPADRFVEGFTCFKLSASEDPLADGSPLRAHLFAYDWFIDSITNGDERGFSRSCFARSEEDSL